MSPEDSPIRCNMSRPGEVCLRPAALAILVVSTCGCEGTAYICAGHDDLVPVGFTWRPHRCSYCDIAGPTAEVTGRRPLNEGDLPDDPTERVDHRWHKQGAGTGS